MSLVSAEQLADAYEAVAQANHHMVGVVSRDALTVDDYDAAEQILIARNNAEHDRMGTKFSVRKHRLELALDILEYDRKRVRGY